MRPTLRQLITYWAPGVEDTFGGKTYAAPVVLRGRFEHRNEQVRTPDGQQIVSRARLYFSQPVEISGYVKEGEVVAADPLTTEGAEEIRTLGSVPDLANLSRLYVAYI